jgi:hypothetical protein
MTVNKFKILVNNNDRELIFPIETNNDFLDQLNNIGEYENEVVKKILNNDDDFEVGRFAHAKHDNSDKTEINYEFYFTPSGSTPTNIVYSNSYVSEGFTPNDIYYYTKPFKQSFFKLDFYDTKQENNQINYLTVILPTQEGLTTSSIVGINTVNIKIPKYKLDFVGDKEGFFVYWLRNRQYLDISTFYMTAKFFDSRLGVFVKMMNAPQNTLGTANTNFNPEEYFYYKVSLDYNDYTYKVYDNNDQRVGEVNPILWYEYVNP